MSGIRVGVVGAGYVGLTTAVCFGERGVDVVSVDVDRAKVERLNAGRPTIAEPGLAEALRAGLATGALRFTADPGALADRDVVFVCVPTPSAADGSADLGAVESVAERLGEVLSPGAVVALKSTVPVGTTRRLSATLAPRGIHAVSNPEFLREGHAVDDFRQPDRMVAGSDDAGAAEAVCRVYGARSGPILRMSPESAELAKYASNAFLAVKSSYANSLAALCANVGADVSEVTRCMGADDRIGSAFLNPGPGWGGSCLPKDTAALVHTARMHGVTLAEVEACRATNAAQAGRVADALTRTTGLPLTSMRVTALGLTFKAHTSDTRDSPALSVCAHLGSEGAHVQGYDPELAAIDPDVLAAARVTAVDDPYRATKAADAVVILTEWPEFGDLDWAMVAEQSPDAVVLDTRNVLDPDVVDRAGLRYLGNGRMFGNRRRG
ncbi:UDP-glucose/GDP-mannose dehydrogenase family protein [Mycolicibacterium sp. P1-18]|uniref:UDP-glucose dehydrogenase family protein n=1 Tax=Mycolicibacterium sp. P1-18 TaxID=2024615 RepID=UPI0011F3D0C6|nr:UDP-glucose/GDP-mannose dehydrogenase family protein [Mycolicibacterium sp. P1-18]KAA0101876.1 UDP-glucose/GDP-mannose dehydrogenase family protein [Mycolicibacterium sp. P1-18]